MRYRSQIDLGTIGLGEFGRVICAGNFLVDGGQGEVQGAAERIDGRPRCSAE